MKKRLVILILISTLNCFSQNAISPRIGNEIDKYEREYFGLFPVIKGFHFAVTSSGQDGSLEVKITRKIDGNLSDSSYQISKKTVGNLAIYIEEFEFCRRGERIVDWNLLAGHAAENVPLFNRENSASNYEIVLREREKLESSILYANDSAIVIWKSNLPFNWRNFENNTRLINCKDIVKLNILRTGNFWPGVGYGALIGAVGSIAAISGNRGNSSLDGSLDGFFVSLFITLGAEIGGIVGAIMNIDIEDEINGNEITFLKLLPDIKRRSVYSAYPPPEVMKLMK